MIISKRYMPILKKGLVTLLIGAGVILPIKTTASEIYIPNQLETEFFSKPANSQGEIKLNPFDRPSNTTEFYGSGDVKPDGIINSEDLQIAKDVRLRPTAYDIRVRDRSDVNVDSKLTSEDEELLQRRIDFGERLPAEKGMWERVTKEERIALVQKAFAIDRSDERGFIPNVWDCGEFTTQTIINFSGWNFQTEIPAKYDTTNKQRFNLPLCGVDITGPSHVPHSLNAILVGDSALNWNNWVFIEPQNDQIVNIGYQLMQPGDDLVFYIPDPVNRETVGGIRFHIDNDSNPILRFAWESNMYTTRPAPTTTVAQPQRPLEFSLSQNAPNPFNPSTMIRYGVDKSGVFKLDIYNTQGQLVRTLFDEHRNSGIYETAWDGRDAKGNDVGSGAYIYRMTSEHGESLVKRMSLVR